MPILAVEGVTKRFGPNEVLKNVSLALERQEIRAICGENGAGKSTLVKIITGVHLGRRGRRSGRRQTGRDTRSRSMRNSLASRWWRRS